MARNRLRRAATSSDATETSEVAAESLEVQHAWRREATKKQIERLWAAMELGREAVPGTPGDENLVQQRELLSELAAAVLGADAPAMEVAS